MRRVSFMSRIGLVQILIVETKIKTSGKWGRNRRNQGGTTVGTWVELNWKLEWKLKWAKWSILCTKVEHAPDQGGN